MQTRRFHSPDLTERSQESTLPPSEAIQAVKVLRLKAGDRLVLMNGLGLVADAEIIDAPSPRNCRCKILAVKEMPRSARPIWLYVAPPHNRTFDAILAAAVELGVSRICPVITQYSVSRPDDCSPGWQVTLIAAMKQSMNPWLPEIVRPMGFAEALAVSPTCGFFGATPHHDCGNVAPQPQFAVQEGMPTVVWVGPEGGFTTDEEAMMQRHGLLPLSVGNHVLRVETAVPALLATVIGILGKNDTSSFS